MKCAIGSNAEMLSFNLKAYNTELKDRKNSFNEDTVQVGDSQAPNSNQKSNSL